jgi:hypothetical protein
MLKKNIRSNDFILQMFWDRRLKVIRIVYIYVMLSMNNNRNTTYIEKNEITW